MAGYECGLCNGAEQATVLITPLTGGETLPIGPDCMATAFTGMLAGTLGIDAEELGKALDKLTRARDRAAAQQASKDQAATEQAPPMDEDPVTGDMRPLASWETEGAGDPGQGPGGPEGPAGGQAAPPEGDQPPKLPGRVPRHAQAHR